jgi:hypothetical protein
MSAGFQPALGTVSILLTAIRVPVVNSVATSLFPNPERNVHFVASPLIDHPLGFFGTPVAIPGIDLEVNMRRKSILNLETNRAEDQQEKLSKRDLLHVGEQTYFVRSSIGTFTATTFFEALVLAKEIFTIRGCWALIKC